MQDVSLIESNAELNLWLRLALKTPTHKNEKTDTEYYIKILDNVAFISFQGSTSKLDWKQNLDFLQVPYKRMPKKFRVHRGFLNKYKSVRNEIFQKIEQVDSVKISGFSQGGALASLLHEDIAFNYPGKLLSTVIFSSPRVFSWFTPSNRFRNLLSIRLNRDIITILPFFLFGYKHVGQIKSVNRKGEKIKNRILRLSIKDHTKLLEATWTFK
jgi:predicted lipase